MSEYAIKITGVEVETEKEKNHDTYIDNIVAGDIIAFKISESVAISAKVTKIGINYRRKVTEVMCVTKNGIIYQVPRSAILWVKGRRWPRFVMDMFRKKDR